jgi:hypothetical protein
VLRIVSIPKSCQGQVISENTLPQLSGILKKTFGKSPLFGVPKDLEGLDFFTALPMSSPMHLPFTHPTLVTSSKWGPGLNEQLQSWVDKQVSVPDAVEKYKQVQESLSQTVDFDDLRVRDITEHEQISLYMQAERNVTMMREQLKVSPQNNTIVRLGSSKIYMCDQSLAEIQQLLRKDDHAKVVIFTSKPGIERISGGGNSSTQLDGLTEPMAKNLRDIEAIRDKMKPQWLKEWEAQQEPPSQ